MRMNMSFIKDHECDVMKNLKIISVEKYSVNGVEKWYYHLHSINENDKVMAILYCPYCGKELESEAQND